MRLKFIPVVTTALMLSILGAGFPASAQELTKEAKIERILVLTKADSMVDQMFSQVKALAVSSPSAATPEQTAKTQELQGKIMDIVRERMSWEKLRPEYVKMYNDTFSDEEIDGLLAFYQSRAGRAMVEKMPSIMSKSLAMSQSLMGDLIPEIERITREAGQR